MLDFTSHRLEELDTNLGAGRVVLDEENPWLPRRPHQGRVARRVGACLGLSADGLGSGHFLHGIAARIIGDCVGDLVDVVRVEGVNADRLADRVHGISVDIVHGIVHHGHGRLRNHNRRVSRRSIHALETLKLSVSNLIRRDAGQELAGSSQLRRRLI